MNNQNWEREFDEQFPSTFYMVVDDDQRVIYEKGDKETTHNIRAELKAFIRNLLSNQQAEMEKEIRDYHQKLQDIVGIGIIRISLWRSSMDKADTIQEKQKCAEEMRKDEAEMKYHLETALKDLLFRLHPSKPPQELVNTRRS